MASDRPSRRCRCSTNSLSALVWKKRTCRPRSRGVALDPAAEAVVGQLAVDGRRAAAELVEVDPVHDLDAVAQRSSVRQLSHGGERRRRRRPRGRWRTRPGASTSTNGHRLARALLVARGRRGHRGGVDARPARVGSPALREQLLDELAQRVLAGEAQRGEQAEADRLAVAVARVAGGGLDRVADGVAEVERPGARRRRARRRRRRAAWCARSRRSRRRRRARPPRRAPTARRRR